MSNTVSCDKSVAEITEKEKNVDPLKLATISSAEVS